MNKKVFSFIFFLAALCASNTQAQEVFDSTAVLHHTTDNALTISCWLQLNNPKENVSIGYWAKSAGNIEDTKADIAIRNGRIIVRKRTRLNPSELSPIAETDFTLAQDETFPTPGDATDGWIFFCLSTTKDKCLLSLSRPGKKLLSKLFYIGVSDVLTSEDTFFFGKSPVKPFADYAEPSSVRHQKVSGRFDGVKDVLQTFYAQASFQPQFRHFNPQGLDGSQNLYVKLKNHQTQRYIDLTTEDGQRIAILSARNDKEKSQGFLLANKKQIGHDGIVIRSLESGDLSPKSQTSEACIFTKTEGAEWEMIFIRNDKNDKPLYAIRPLKDNNARLLGAIDSPNLILSSKDAYTANGEVKDSFLWSIDVLPKE